MKRILLPLLFLILVTACRTRKKQDPITAGIKPSFPVMSYIRSQVKHIDTSLYNIRKVVILDSLHSDTSFLKREEFRAAAKEFLDLPDLTDPSYADRFTESRFFDQDMNRVIFSVVPTHPEQEIIKRQQVLITPSVAGDKVSSIIIEKTIENKDGFLNLEMLWQVDKLFQIITTTQKPGGDEKVVTERVIWDDGDN